MAPWIAAFRFSATGLNFATAIMSAIELMEGYVFRGDSQVMAWTYVLHTQWGLSFATLVVHVLFLLGFGRNRDKELREQQTRLFRTLYLTHAIAGVLFTSFVSVMRIVYGYNYNEDKPLHVNRTDTLADMKTLDWRLMHLLNIVSGLLQVVFALSTLQLELAYALAADEVFQLHWIGGKQAVSSPASVTTAKPATGPSASSSVPVPVGIPASGGFFDWGRGGGLDSGSESD
jgi:hypothetical protein